MNPHAYCYRCLGHAGSFGITFDTLTRVCTATVVSQEIQKQLTFGNLLRLVAATFKVKGFYHELGGFSQADWATRRPSMLPLNKALMAHGLPQYLDGLQAGSHCSVTGKCRNITTKYSSWAHSWLTQPTTWVCWAFRCPGRSVRTQIDGFVAGDVAFLVGCHLDGPYCDAHTSSFIAAAHAMVPLALIHMQRCLQRWFATSVGAQGLGDGSLWASGVLFSAGVVFHHSFAACADLSHFNKVLIY